jgi:hypothetical protein
LNASIYIDDLEFRKVTRKKSTKKRREVIFYGDAWEKTVISDLDKVLTYSHCRMELDALYGIGNVLAIDSDEFLHCSADAKDPETLLTPKAQYNRILEEVKKGKEAGRLSIRFQQNQPTNTTEIYPAECVKDKLSNNKSILSCWGSKIIYTYDTKTLSLGFNCPVTHFHNAHDLSGQARSYDCGADPLTDVHQSCKLIHLATGDSYLEFHAYYSCFISLGSYYLHKHFFVFYTRL